MTWTLNKKVGDWVTSQHTQVEKTKNKKTCTGTRIREHGRRDHINGKIGNHKKAFIFFVSVQDSPLPPPSSPALTKTRWTSTPLARLSAPWEYPALCFNTQPPRLKKKKRRRRRKDTPVPGPPLPCTPCFTPLRSPSAPAQMIRQNQTPRLPPNKRHHTQTQNCAVSWICPELVSVALCAPRRLTRCPLSFLFLDWNSTVCMSEWHTRVRPQE